MLISRDENGNLESGLDESTKLVMGGMLIDAERKFSKAGKEFCIAKLEDLYGTVELMLSGGKVPKFKSMWTSDTMVKVTGRMSLKDDGVTVFVDSIEPWSVQKTNTSAKMLCIYLSFKSIEASTLDNIYEVITAYPGDDEVYIKNTDDGKVSKITTTVNACDMLRNELFGVDGVSDAGIYSKN